MATKIALPSQARRIHTADLPALVSRDGVQLIGMDVAPATVATAEKPVGVFDLPASPSAVPALAEVIADHVVSKLHASGVPLSLNSANVTAVGAPTANCGPGTGSRKLLYFDLSTAAQRLGTTKQALKKYLARHQRRDGRDTVCSLGAGARAVKIRGRWRVRFDDEGRP